MTDPGERRLTAIHESAHAVAFLVLGRPVEYASIRPGKTFHGLVQPSRHAHSSDGFEGEWHVPQQPAALRADIEQRVIAILAGDLAALYLHGEPTSGYTSDEAETIARDALAQLGPRVAELVVGNERRDDLTDSDEASAWRLAQAFAGPEVDVYYLAWLRAEAHTLVGRHRAAILRVADALERHAVLAGDQIAALVKGA